MPRHVWWMGLAQRAPCECLRGLLNVCMIGLQRLHNNKMSSQEIYWHRGRGGLFIRIVVSSGGGRVRSVLLMLPQVVRERRRDVCHPLHRLVARPTSLVPVAASLTRLRFKKRVARPGSGMRQEYTGALVHNEQIVRERVGSVT